jgi:hypothetical protein
VLDRDVKRASVGKVKPALKVRVTMVVMTSVMLTMV